MIQLSYFIAAKTLIFTNSFVLIAQIFKLYTGIILN